MLDQKPFVIFLAAFETHVHKASVSLLPVLAEFQFTTLNLGRGAFLAFRLIGPLVPNNDFAGAVISFRNRSLEGSIFKRMIFDLDGQPFVAGVEGRPFRHRPRFQYTTELEAQIIVKPPGRMFLDDKNLSAFVSSLAARFGSLPKPSLFSVLAQAWHVSRIIEPGSLFLVLDGLGCPPGRAQKR